MVRLSACHLSACHLWLLRSLGWDPGIPCGIRNSRGHGSIVDSLIQAGASVDVQSNNGNTALILASDSGHGSIVDSLLEQHRFLYHNGVDPNPLRRLKKRGMSLEG